MRNIICFILSLCTYVAIGQEHWVNGLVTDSTQTGIYDVHILNTTLNIGTTSNKEGNFEIPIRINDTLEISSVQYIKVVKIIQQNDVLQDLTIVLKRNNSLLPDVVLSPYTPFLDTTSVESGDIDLNLPFDHNFVMRPYTERQYDILKPKVKFYGIGVAASVLGSFTKEFKEIKALKKIKEKHQPSVELHEMFEETFYTKTLDIPNGKSAIFIDYCLEQEPELTEFVKSKDIYKLIERLKYHSKGFIEQFTE